MGLATTTPTIPEFLKGFRPPTTSLIWGYLEIPPGAGVRGLTRNFSQAGLRNAGREDLADLAVE